MWATAAGASLEHAGDDPHHATILASMSAVSGRFL